MARLEAPATKQAAPKKMTAREKRVAQATRSVSATGVAPARRGEADDTLATASAPAEEPTQPAEAVVPRPADEGEVHVPPSDAVVKASEENNPFEFVKPPEDADPFEQIGMARRGIAQANRGLANGLGKLQRDYVASAGEYLWWATQGTRLKDAGFKSIEKFAEPLGLTKQDVYRLRRAVPVYRIIGDMVEEPLNERTIRELFSTIVDEKGEIGVTPDGEPDVSPERQKNLRDQFTEMKKMGRVNSGGAVAARRLLMLGEATDVITPEPGSSVTSKAVEQLAKARRTNRIIDLEVLREAKEEDPDEAKQYVEDLRRRYEAAAEIVG
jgi:hypothetical protein